MSGTDVARSEAIEGTAKKPKKTNGFLTFLKVWLPFPVILGAILFFQYRSGTLDGPGSPEDEVSSVFEGAGEELPLLLESLQSERTELQKEWDQLRFAERRIFLASGEIEKRKEEIETLLARVDANVQVMEEERDRMIGQLARVYETMKPDAAAEILAGIDVDTSTEILRRMKERQAAQVMASLEPKSAARISQRMLRQ